MYALENDLLKIDTRPHGGELTAVTSKKTGTEYLWSGDPAHWQYHAPVLFPIVGKVNGGVYSVDGKEYAMPQHGLARKQLFEMTEKTADHITFKLTDNDETLSVYPFRFALLITYRLSGNRVETEYRVENADERTIFFSIGGHPAFMCPMQEQCALSDYYFEFEQNEQAERMTLSDAGLFTRETTPFLNNEKVIPLTYALFDRDAIVFANLKSKSVALKSERHRAYLRFHMNDFPYLGLWTKADAPFVCIEPWFGHADYVDFKGAFSEKAGIVSLEKGASFQTSYGIEICEE
ncbi:MAG: aldose 1-epimerase family protein [Clostridiales bacterium]|jgi:galactose mutarotase-like enzyme|nr:aldose 1-epimerase family protein [Clostridiales bacterium]